MVCIRIKTRTHCGRLPRRNRRRWLSDVRRKRQHLL